MFLGRRSGGNGMKPRFHAPVLFDSFTMAKPRRDGLVPAQGQPQRILVPG